MTRPHPARCVRGRRSSAPIAGLTLLVLAPAVLGCAERQETEAVSRGGTVVIAEGADMDKPNPLVNESSLDNDLNSMLYRPLLQSWWENGELVFLTAEENPMALARSYEFFGPDSA